MDALPAQQAPFLALFEGLLAVRAKRLRSRGFLGFSHGAAPFAVLAGGEGAFGGGGHDSNRAADSIAALITCVGVVSLNTTFHSR